MREIYIIIPAWEENADQCLVVESQKESNISQAPKVQLLYVDKEEYAVIKEMIRLVHDEERIYKPQNSLPI